VAIERFCGRRLEPIRLVGGGARSELWSQIFADVLDRRVERAAEPLLVNLRGAARLAGLAIAALRLADLPSLVSVDRELQPDLASRDVHGRLGAEPPRLHRAQRGLSAYLGGAGG
jgi:xylulokinase